MLVPSEGPPLALRIGGKLGLQVESSSTSRKHVLSTTTAVGCSGPHWNKVMPLDVVGLRHLGGGIPFFFF